MQGTCHMCRKVPATCCLQMSPREQKGFSTLQLHLISLETWMGAA